MTTKKKVILGISIATIVGVGGYFLYKYIKDNRPATDEDDDEGGTVQNNDPNTQQSSSGTIRTPSTSGGSRSDRPDDTLAFQKYANGQGYTPKLTEDGLWGPKTSKAWKKHGTAYKTKETADKASGELTGQLKTIFGNINKVNKPKVYPRNYKGQGTALMVEAKGTTSGNVWYWVENGSYLAYNPTKSPKWFQSGNYANNGKTLIITAGINKGKTFTGASPAKTASTASKPVIPAQQKKTLSNSQVADIVLNMYNAMDGAGTYYPIFMNQWKRMKTAADWSAVYHTFGKKDGENLWQWMKGESALQTSSAKAYFNKWFKDRGSSNRF